MPSRARRVRALAPTKVAVMSAIASWCNVLAIWVAATAAVPGCVDPEPDDDPGLPVGSSLTATYNLTGRAVPAVGEPAAFIDTRLSLTFDGPPVLGTTGTVRILRRSDDAVVDTIKPTAETNTLGFPGQSRVRIVNVE